METQEHVLSWCLKTETGLGHTRVNVSVLNLQPVREEVLPVARPITAGLHVEFTLSPAHR